MNRRHGFLSCTTNRTNLELKRGIGNVQRSAHESTNRTNLELKHSQDWGSTAYGFDYQSYQSGIETE